MTGGPLYGSPTSTRLPCWAGFALSRLSGPRLQAPLNAPLAPPTPTRQDLQGNSHLAGFTEKLPPGRIYRDPFPPPHGGPKHRHVPFSLPPRATPSRWASFDPRAKGAVPPHPEGLRAPAGNGPALGGPSARRALPGAEEPKDHTCHPETLSFGEDASGRTPFHPTGKTPLLSHC